jgi:hypothetical protein
MFGSAQLRKRPVAPSYASESWSQITGSRARAQERRQYGSRAGVGLAREAHLSPPLTWVWPCIVQHHPKGRGLSAVLKVLTLPHTCRMAKKPEPPKPIIWNVYKITSKAFFLGIIEALTKAQRLKEPRSQAARHEADGDTAMTRRKAKSPAVISSPMAASAGAAGRKGTGPHKQVRRSFARPVSYRRRRYTPCAAMTPTSWGCDLQSRKRGGNCRALRWRAVARR